MLLAWVRLVGVQRQLLAWRHLVLPPPLLLLLLLGCCLQLLLAWAVLLLLRLLQLGGLPQLHQS